MGINRLHTSEKGVIPIGSIEERGGRLRNVLAEWESRKISTRKKNKGKTSAEKDLEPGGRK